MALRVQHTQEKEVDRFSSRNARSPGGAVR